MLICFDNTSNITHSFNHGSSVTTNRLSIGLGDHPEGESVEVAKHVVSFRLGLPRRLLVGSYPSLGVSLIESRHEGVRVMLVPTSFWIAINELPNLVVVAYDCQCKEFEVLGHVLVSGKDPEFQT